MNSFTHVPPGFRFHPTDEELVDYYLRKKISSQKIDLNVIKDVDLYKIEPWDLEELCQITSEAQDEWYFFSHKDKKYPTGTRTNRATKAGFWKATGRDKAIYSRHCLVGMRKTLVFYKGRAPNGLKSDWIMHEYRLETNENGTPHQEEGWVVCRVFKKRMAVMRKMGEYESPCWYDDQVISFVQEIESRRQNSHLYASYHQHYSCKQESELQYSMTPADGFLQLPQLESPTVPQSGQSLSYLLIPYSYEKNSNTCTVKCSTFSPENHTQCFHPQNLSSIHCNNVDQAMSEVTDWRALGNFFPSHLSQDQGDSKEANAAVLDVAEQINLLSNASKGSEFAHDYGSTSVTSCPIEQWK